MSEPTGRSIKDRWAADEEQLAANPPKMLAEPRWMRDRLKGYDPDAPPQPTMDDIDPR